MDSPDPSSQDREVFFGQKRTKYECHLSSLFGQNYDSPVAKTATSNSTGDPTNLPDVLNKTPGPSKSSAGLALTAESGPEYCQGGKENSLEVIDLESNGGSIQIISDDESILLNSFTSENEISKSEIPQDDINVSADAHLNKQENKVIEDEHKSEDSTVFSIEALIKASIDIENEKKPSVLEGKQSDSDVLNASMEEKMKLSMNDRNSNIAETSDSVLNISHGSSLSSPVLEKRRKSSLGLLGTAIYEDISFPGDSLVESVQNTDSKQETVSEDLHMSVDETDHEIPTKLSYVEALVDVTQSTLYQSCTSKWSSNTASSACSEFTTLPYQSCSSFSSYRENFDDSVSNVGLDTDDLDTVGENVKERSFEIVAQNRQNSFNSAPATNISEESTKSQSKQQFASKLPVFHSSSSILKPSQFHVEPDLLQAKNHKWAKNLPKSDAHAPGKNNFTSKPQINNLKTTSSPNLLHKSSSKTSKYTHVVSKVKSLIETPAIKVTSQTPSNTPQKVGFSEIKTPLIEIKVMKSASATKVTDKKTPAKSLIATKITDGKTPSKNVAAIKGACSKTPAKTMTVTKITDGKTPAKCLTATKGVDGKSPAKSLTATRVIDTKTPAKSLSVSHLPLLVKSDSKTPRPGTLSVKRRYDNIKSPLHAYINGNPTTLQRKAKHGTDERIMPVNAKPKEHHVSEVSKVVQKLNYNLKTQDQENHDPNDTQDTLPLQFKVCSPASAVFMKEPDLPIKYFPKKMGVKMRKLIEDLPRPKITRHEGRVDELPNAKGQLYEVTRPSGRAISPDSPARISVRVTKYLELP